MNLPIITALTKSLKDDGVDVGAGSPPRYWLSTGNYTLNKIMSGSFHKGLPQGRLTCYTGPSGAGKSFLITNAIKQAQNDDYQIIVLDSENALDSEFVRKIGVDPDSKYAHIGVTTIQQTKKITSSIITSYRKEYGTSEDAPKILIVIDSLDMMMTETEQDNFDKGVSKGDQGQRNKQLKAMLREFVQAIKNLNITMAVTSQVYKNQDVLNGEGLWIVSDAIRFSLSMVMLLTKLKLKDTTTKEVTGIRMKVEGFKTRFTKPFQVAVFEIPYDTGMDPYDGLLDVALNIGVCIKKGSRYAIVGDESNSWYAKDFNKVAEIVLAKCEENSDKFLDDLASDSSDYVVDSNI